jgi:hypothetical protein
MALAALGAVAALDVGTATAEAAPSVSPFAGTYAWTSWPAPITVADGGRITSSYSGFSRTKGSISGRVSADGSYSFTVSETFYDYPERGKGTWTTSSYESAGNMTLDAAGNIVGTTDTGGSFVWLRQ